MASGATVDIRFDDKDFQQALIGLTKTSSKEVTTVYNRKMYFIALRALKKTPKADRTEIEQDLGIVGYKIRRTRKHGPRRLQRGARIMGRGRSDVYAIVQSQTKGNLKGKELQKAVRKFIGARLRAIGSLRAGWIGGLRTFWRTFTGFKPNAGRHPRLKHERGKGWPAKPNKNKQEAKLRYRTTVATSSGSKSRKLDPRVLKATRQAFREEYLDMKRVLEERLSRGFKKYKAR